MPAVGVEQVARGSLNKAKLICHVPIKLLWRSGYDGVLGLLLQQGERRAKEHYLYKEAERREPDLLKNGNSRARDDVHYLHRNI